MGLSKRILAATIVSTIAIFCPPLLEEASGQQFGAVTFTSQQFVEYERQLNAILKTRRDEEKKFVADVVRQVRLGKIPSKLVSTSYGWIRNKRPNTSYPFLYFERVIRLQAERAKLGKEIPRFDNSIYKSAGQAAGRRNYSVGQRPDIARQITPSAGLR